MSFTFQKSERLCSKKIIEQLFETRQAVNGSDTSRSKDVSSFNLYPFRFAWLRTSFESEFPVQVLFVVSRRNFPKATQRNRIKRQLRELYRMEKERLYQSLSASGLQFAVMIAYISKEKKMIFADAKKIFHKSILRLNAELEKNNQRPVPADDPIL
ncbi:MAG: ribonuclease P protein component [Bacteroidia bacterium]